MKATQAFSVSIFLGFAVACGVEVDIDNKACPCGTGYVCDTVKNRCVKTGTALTTVPKPICDPCTCAKDADCTDPTRPSCAPAGTNGTKICAECNPANDTCREGTYCNAKFQCVSGCRTADYCAKISPGTTCNLSRHQCVQCVSDATCPGQTCSPSGQCVDTCDGVTKLCPTGQDCCNKLCIPVQNDALNCGACNKVCTANNGTPLCQAGVCTQQCADGYATCATSGAGCETAIRTDALNCGGCGNDCATTVLNATGVACVAGKCTETGCLKGFIDLDQNGANGCETPCGAKNEICCDKGVCDTGLSCKGGKCTGSG